MQNGSPASKRTGSRAGTGALVLFVFALTALGGAAPPPAEPPTSGEAPVADGPEPKPTVALFRRPAPDDDALRSQVAHALRDAFETRGVARTIEEARRRLKCDRVDESCLERAGRWLAKNGIAADYLVYETVEEGEPWKPHVIAIYDVSGDYIVRELRFASLEGDLILPIVLPGAVARVVREHHEPPPPMTEEEQRIMAALDRDPEPRTAGWAPYTATAPPELPTSAVRCRVGVDDGDSPGAAFITVSLLALVVRWRRRRAGTGYDAPDAAHEHAGDPDQSTRGHGDRGQLRGPRRAGRRA